MKLDIKLDGKLNRTHTMVSDLVSLPKAYLNSRKNWVFRIKSIGEWVNYKKK